MFKDGENLKRYTLYLIRFALVRSEKRWRMVRSLHVALRDGRVSAKPMELCSTDRALLKERGKGRFIQLGKFLQVGREGPIGRLKGLFTSGLSS